MKNTWLVIQEDGKFKSYPDLEKARTASNQLHKKFEGQETDYAVGEMECAYDIFFIQGTYDEVHIQNLQTQRTMFHLINDGIADESILKEGQIKFRGIDIENRNGNEKD